MSGHPIVQKKLNLRASDVRGDFRLNVDLDIRLDGITAIFGRSGAGKSSLLRLIAGLDQIEDAHVQMGEQIWQCQSSKVWVPAHKRQIGYIFQTPGLFEHLSVQGNLDYAAKRASARYPVDMALLGVDQLLHRRVSGLSGGERQRVALARALVSNPGMLLMDEPVSALDNQSKEQVLILIQELQRSTAIPVLYVSHSVDEVARISDWLVLLREGRVIAQGKTLEMLTHPEIAQDSDVLETVVEAEVVALDEAYGLCRLRFPGGDLWVANSRLKSGEKTRARIMARDVSLTLERQVNTSIQNVLPARIVDIRVPSKSNAGLSQVVVELDISGCRLLALLTRRSVDQLTLSKGKRVFAQIKSVALLS